MRLARARVLLTFALLQACSNGEPAERSATSTGQSGGIAFNHELIRTDLPSVDRGWRDTVAFGFSDSDNARLYALWQAVNVQCMAAQGFEYRPIEYPAAEGPADRINPLDRKYAEAMGYHPMLVEINDPNLYTDEAFNLAIDGPNGGDGCAATGYERVYGPFEEFITAADIAFSSFDSNLVGFEGTEVGMQKLRLWSDCMQQQGYSYRTPFEAGAAFAEAVEITSQEIKVRLSDLDCDIQVGLTQARHDYQAARIDQWLTDNEGMVRELTTLKANFDEQLVLLETDILGKPAP